MCVIPSGVFGGWLDICDRRDFWTVLWVKLLVEFLCLGVILDVFWVSDVGLFPLSELFHRVRGRIIDIHYCFLLGKVISEPSFELHLVVELAEVSGALEREEEHRV